MRNARRARLAVLAAVALATAGAGVLAACAAADELRSADVQGSDAGSGGGDASFSSDAGSPPPIGIANGVVLLHAAAFPAFRVCFENYPDFHAQPDTTLMPRSNTVGVEQGSAVRIPPLETPPGKVYVFFQKKVVASRGDPSDPSCRELIAANLERLDYFEAGEIDQPLGTDHVTVLAITGCGNAPYLSMVGVNSADCEPPWDDASGSLRARTLTIQPGTTRPAKDFPVQLFHLSAVLEKERAASPLSVTFGDLDASGPLAQKVADAPPLFDASAPVTLALEQTAQVVYKTHGFRVAYGNANGTTHFDQTLASVQERSAPDSVPMTYFTDAETYALLLLGDPRVPRTIDGGANPAFPLRSVHLVAIPIIRGVDAGTLTPADGGNVDSGSDSGP